MCCFALGFYCRVCECRVCRMCYFCSRMFEDSKFYCGYYYFYNRVQLLLFRLVCCFLLCKVECCFLLCVLVSVVFYCVQTSVCGSGDYRLPPLGIWSPAWEWINPWRTCSQFLELLILYHPSPSQKHWHAWETSCSALQIAALKTTPAPFPPRQEAAAGKSTRFIREKPELTSGWVQFLPRTK